MMYPIVLLVLALFLIAPGDAPVFEPAPCPRAMPSSVECGYVVVPEDRAHPDSGSIRLAVAIFRTSNPQPEPDPLLFLDGGPGSRTLDAWSSGLDSLVARVGRERDVVVFDQRGMGYSEPALTCPEKVDAGSDDWLDRCHDRLVEAGINLAAYTTRENASDAADLMRSLGYSSYNVWGGSYGSSLALTLLRDHPEGIRSVVVTALQPIQVSLQELLAPMFERSIDLLAEQCAADEACSATFPGDMREKLYAVIDRLDEHPVEFEVEGQLQSLDGSLLIGGLSQLMKHAEYLPQIPGLIEALYAEQYSVVIPYAQALSSPPDPGSPDGAFWSMRCTDSALAAIPESFDARLMAVDPALRGHFRQQYEAELETCRMWGAHIPTDEEQTPAVSNVPMLILNGEFDPYSSPENVELTLETIPNGHAFWFPGYGHGVNSDFCAQRIFYEFVIDPAQRPDAMCIDLISPLQFATP